ncbi:1-acyl-sn-glycerol-3-phosphate acyltransferase alpha-like [Thamnophis elegans]|uniref:1-acyl-sn-glycerol-3-phosphate acyltransferase alpha-like n=1 Tax=Thamnophis elegans TaxID=35005 RepID=UPI001377A8A8|nr:1-acyl-sn-glycerol-3-phosphate acyltransferase alpha-like [Thamnophis elegans]
MNLCNEDECARQSIGVTLLLHSSTQNIYNITLTVQGSENFNIKQSYVIVCNHQTNFDLLAMAEILPKRCVPLTKKELLYWGPLGFSGWLCSLVFIDRKKQHQAKDTLEQLSERMQHEKLRIWVYPEGTRNREDTMLPFKRGAFHLAIKAQVPIVPVVISSYRDFYSLEDKRFDPGNLTIRILPKIETQGLDLQDISGLVERTRNLMQDTFNDISGKIVQKMRVMSSRDHGRFRKNSGHDEKSILEKMLTVRGRIPCPFKSNITKYGLFDHIPAIQDVGYGQTVEVEKYNYILNECRMHYSQVFEVKE